MNVIDKEVLIKVLNNVFEKNLSFIEERRNFSNLISKSEEKFKDFFIEVDKEEIAKQKENADSAIEKKLANQEYKEEYFRIKREIAEIAEKKRETIKKNIGNKELILLLNEFEEKYKDPIIKNGFVNEVSIKNNFMMEDIKYEKKYGEVLFSVVFYMNHTNSEVKQLTISSTNLNDEKETAFFCISFENIDMKIISISTDKNYVPTGENSPEFLKFLEHIKEDDLYDLNLKETEEIHLMLYDYSLKLSEKPIYEVFKIGLKDFQDTIKKELLLEKKMTNKM